MSLFQAANREPAEQKSKGRQQPATKKQVNTALLNGLVRPPRPVYPLGLQSTGRGYYIIFDVLEGRPITGSKKSVPREVVAEAVRRGIPIERLVDNYFSWLDSLASAAEETTGAQAVLSEVEVAAFTKHAQANIWVAKNGQSASEFIKTTFAKWLGRGLTRQHLLKVQANLVQAYSAEVSRDPTRRIPNLVVKPHKLPAGTPPVLRATKRVSELPESELEQRRADDRLRYAGRKSGGKMPKRIIAPKGPLFDAVRKFISDGSKFPGSRKISELAGHRVSSKDAVELFLYAKYGERIGTDLTKSDILTDDIKLYQAVDDYRKKEGILPLGIPSTRSQSRERFERAKKVGLGELTPKERASVHQATRYAHKKLEG